MKIEILSTLPFGQKELLKVRASQGSEPVLDKFVEVDADVVAALRSRRRALGLTRKQMAAGIGMRLADVAEIERGEASDGRMNHYAGWLERMERWPADERERQIELARRGERFRV